MDLFRLKKKKKNVYLVIFNYVKPTPSLGKNLLALATYTF